MQQLLLPFNQKHGGVVGPVAVVGVVARVAGRHCCIAHFDFVRPPSKQLFIGQPIVVVAKQIGLAALEHVFLVPLKPEVEAIVAPEKR